MSFYRTLLAAIATVVIASPVFADDTTNTMPGTPEATPATQTDNNTMSSTATPATDTAVVAKMNVNKASVKELMKVKVDGKNLGAAKAKAIVAYRKKHGDFKSLDDLANVKGFKKMKPDMMKALEDQLSTD